MSTKIAGCNYLSPYFNGGHDDVIKCNSFRVTGHLFGDRSPVNSTQSIIWFFFQISHLKISYTFSLIRWDHSKCRGKVAVISRHTAAAAWTHPVLVTHITVTSLCAQLRLKSPASGLFTKSFIQAQIKENIKDLRHWPLCGEFTGDLWIPRTNDQ